MRAGLTELLKYAGNNGIAIGAFNTPNLETVLAVIGAAETMNVPVIIAHAQVHELYSRLEDIGPVMVCMAEKASVPVCVHLDHTSDAEYIDKAINIGFNSIMMDNSKLSFEENLEKTFRMTKHVHSLGVDIEAELGRIPTNRMGIYGYYQHETNYTDPELVVPFVSGTDVDALAIAFGTVHGTYIGAPKLDFSVVSEIVGKTPVPLVMHGGSGLSDSQYREAIKSGIRKINYHTYMSIAGYNAAASYAEEETDGRFHELAYMAQKAMRDNVTNVIRVFYGKAFS